MYLFKPYDAAWPDVVCGSSTRDVTHNQIAIVTVETTLRDHVVDPARPKPRGLLFRLLGHVGDADAERVGLLEHYCQGRQPSSSSYFDDEGGEGPDYDNEDVEHPPRLEISAATGWITFHVDPAGCRDVDDAIAWHPQNKQWAITIADVAAFVPANSYMDRIAAAIGATFYDLDGRVVRPMLPADISEGAASLLPSSSSRRAGVSYIYNACAPDDGQFALTWITIAHSFTYEQFCESSVANTLGLTEVEPHDWIAQMMIRYNAAAARELVAAGTGLLRVQGPADAAAVATWAAVHPDLAALANEVATYEVVSAGADQGHTTLGLTAYCHASSPLRRYADIVNQRILKAIIVGSVVLDAIEPTATLAATLNERGRAQRRWTRDLVFLANVQPGHVMEIEVVWVGGGQVWVPAWRRLLRLRHEEERAAGVTGYIQIYCDPSRRNWKQRVLTGYAAADV
jgi:exoribonuclease R